MEQSSIPEDLPTADELERMTFRTGKGYLAEDVDSWRNLALSTLRATHLALLAAEAEVQELKAKAQPLPSIDELVTILGPAGLRDAGLRAIGTALELAIETATTHKTTADEAIRISLEEVIVALRTAASDLVPARSPHATMADAEAALVRAVQRLTKVTEMLFPDT